MNRKESALLEVHFNSEGSFHIDIFNVYLFNQYNVCDEIGSCKKKKIAIRYLCVNGGSVWFG